MNNDPIRYSIRPFSPQAHLFSVTCSVAAPDPEGQRFSMPIWIAGSYLIREFARHVVTIKAASRGRPVSLRKLDKSTWQTAPCSGPLTVHYEVYAFDSSVRAAYLDTFRGFFNGPAVFLQVEGQEDRPHQVEISAPRGVAYRRWQVATAMRRAGARPNAFGVYEADNYVELIDHPVEMGEFSRVAFRAGSVPHEVVISGRHQADLRRLARDLKRMCEAQIAFWGETPMDRYVFLVNAVGEGYGGLEHRASTALICSRNELPREGTAGGDEYRTFLGLASHEYFHTWNVKRIRPAAFAPYDLKRENYTTLLWAFEGITSYYDDLLLARAGLIGERQYLEAVARTITQVLRAPGRLKQTLEESSFDAWIKFYRMDENTPNAVVSYYQKGSLVALCLDLLIRSRTNGRRSLDHVMRALWRRHGRTGVGVEEGGIERMAEEVTGLRLRSFFDRALRSTAELPLAPLLRSVGVEMKMRPAESSNDRGGKPASAKDRELASRATLGVRTRMEGGDLRITHVLDGSAAQQAGVCAGDVVVALDGLRVTGKSLDEHLARRRAGQLSRLHVFRRDELMTFDVRFPRPPKDTCVLETIPDRGAERRRRTWLRAKA
jgi:predicted metalloprotease with PDZ domain